MFVHFPNVEFFLAESFQSQGLLNTVAGARDTLGVPSRQPYTDLLVQLNGLQELMT